MEYYSRTILGKTEFSTCRTIKTIYPHKNYEVGTWVSNPPEALIAAEGWKPYIVPPPSLYEGSEPLPSSDYLFAFFDKHPEQKQTVLEIENGVIYHYTSWEVLFNGILASKNLANHYVVLRLYSINFMNDYSEGLILPNMIMNKEESVFRSRLSDKKEDLIQNLQRLSLYERRKQIADYSAKKNKIKHFSTSFSHNPDSLPMWNYYGKKGEGLAIGFQVKEILNQGYKVFDCIYDDSRKEELASIVYKDYRGSRLEDLLGVLYKDKHFAYEEECRLPVPAFSEEYCLTLRNQFLPIQYGMKDGLIAPFVEVLLPLSSISCIYIGPTNSPDRATDSLKGWLDRIGMNKVSIHCSSAPLA